MGVCVRRRGCASHQLGLQAVGLCARYEDCGVQLAVSTYSLSAFSLLYRIHSFHKRAGSVSIAKVPTQG